MGNGTVRKHVVRLSAQQREELEAIVRSQQATLLKGRRARVLLLSDVDHSQGRRCDWQIAEIVGLTEKQVKRIRTQFVQQGLPCVLQRQRRRDADRPRKIDGQVEAQVIALCCSQPPEGRQRWTLTLLVEELTRLQVVASVCRETVRKTLKKIDSSLGKPVAFASRKKTGPDSLPVWNDSWMSIKPSTITRTR